VSADREPSILGKKEDERPEESGDRHDTEIDDRSETLDAEASERSDTELDGPHERSDTEIDERSPAALEEAGAEPEAEPEPASGKRERAPRASSRAHAGPTYHVAGFWRRLGGGLIDLAVVLPVSLVLGWLAGAVSGIHLPESRHRGIDFWLDLFLANDPAFVGWMGLAVVVGCIYLMVFQTVMGRTLGMRATKTRIIDVYGDPPTVPRAGIRTGGYLLGLATLGLGFIWIGFDSEKRGVQDWVASTYVIKD
jgi:uncharacterized RDD family membrane protein YckC